MTPLDRLDFTHGGLNLWLLPQAHGATGTVGVIGDIRFDANPALLLKVACDRLRAAGAATVVAPMQGSTWAPYRLIQPDPELDEPAFTGEPVADPTLTSALLQAGFQVAEQYVSRILDDPAPLPGFERRRNRLVDRGVSIHAPRPDELPALLPQIYTLLHRAFRHSPYFSPLSPTDFAAITQREAPATAARGWVAVDDSGRLLGMLRSHPDAVAPPRLIARTIAVDPDYAHLGLGATLLDCFHDVAAESGCAVIHALMHVENQSVRLSERHGGRLLRRYALYRLDLASPQPQATPLR